MKAAAKQLSAPAEKGGANDQRRASGDSTQSNGSDAVAGAAHPNNAETISEAAHKRLEARISELKLDREAVKKYVKDTFGRDHFTEMTKEEYDKLDKMIEMRALKIAKAAQTATEDGGP